jgi:7-alpha-hydroxysteroid dehydrogenase
VVVTGGGTGIGAACALKAAREGARVTICGRTEGKLQNTAEQVRAEGGEIAVVVADITSEEDVARLMAAAAEFGSGLDGVVANAGGGGMVAPYHLQDAAEFTRVLHQNLVGTFLCIKHAVPHLARSGRGSFIGMSSIAGHVTHLYFGAYPPSKAGIEEMIRNAADEYGPTRIRFNAIRPGFISTEIMEGVPRDSDVYNSYIENTPMQDVGEPEDVASLARFLVGPDARWITGQIINVDGGHALRRGPDFSSFLVPALGWDVMLAKKAPGQ